MKKYIGYYENIVEDKICDSIISYTEKSKVLTPSTYSTSAGKSARSSDRVSMSDSWFKNADTYYTEIKKCYEKVISYNNRGQPTSEYGDPKPIAFRINSYTPNENINITIAIRYKSIAPMIPLTICS